MPRRQIDPMQFADLYHRIMSLPDGVRERLIAAVQGPATLQSGEVVTRTRGKKPKTVDYPVVEK